MLSIQQFEKVTLFQSYVQGSRVPIDVRKVRLQAGDVILLNASVDFAQRYSNHKAFSVIAGIKDSSPQKKRAMWIAVFLASGKTFFTFFHEYNRMVCY